MWLKLYDAARTPAHWSKMIREGECCVFILDASQRAPRDFDGRPFAGGEASVEIAADFEAAVAFAREVTGRHPELCCEIYGHEGKSGKPLETVYEASVRGHYDGPAFARRNILTGLALFCAASVFIVYDVSHRLQWIWGYVIGLKLFVTGVVFLVRGIAGWWEWRGESARVTGKGGAEPNAEREPGEPERRDMSGYLRFSIVAF